MTSEANTSCLREREMRARGTGDGVFANDNCRRLNDNYEPRQMDITNLAMTGRSSCRRPAILVDVDHGPSIVSALIASSSGSSSNSSRPPPSRPRAADAATRR